MREELPANDGRIRYAQLSSDGLSVVNVIVLVDSGVRQWDGLRLVELDESTEVAIGYSYDGEKFIGPENS